MSGPAVLKGSGGVLDLQHYTTPMLDMDAACRIQIIDQFDQLLGDSTAPYRHATPVGAFPATQSLRLDKVWHLNVDPLRRVGESAFMPADTHLELTMAGTPMQLAAPRGLAAFETTTRLAFDAARASWEAMNTALRERITTDVASQPHSKAFRAFRDLARWLNRTEEETAALVGVGRTTPYTWERDRREPQPRSARRLYETHAFVRQLVLAMGEEAGRAALDQGGDSSALALIASNRVAEAEAQFADVIYARPTTDDMPLGASRSGDNDLPDSVPMPERQTGGRRRVQVRRSR